MYKFSRLNTRPLALTALVCAALAQPCLADSSTSSASSAGSASVGSLSDSVKGSSNSSTGNTKVAEGPYRVMNVAALADQPGQLRVQLQALQDPGASGQLWLTLPQQALAGRGLQAGDLVAAQHRPYGVAFAYLDQAANGAAKTEPFFLALAPGWNRELAPQAITL